MTATTRHALLMVWQQTRHIGPLSLIILLHLGFFYALHNGLQQPAVPALPKEVSVSFITPEQPYKPTLKPPAQALVPKLMPIVKRSVAPRPVPVVDAPPLPRAISAAPPSLPAPVELPSAAAPAPVPTPAPLAPPAAPKTLSSGVEYIRPPQPDYPPLARRMGEEGRVTLRVLIDAKGQPERVEVQRSSGFARLDEAGKQAALRALFRPHIEGGQAVVVYVIVPITFQLNN